MRTLDGADDARGLCGLPGQRAAALGLGVERGLQILEDKRVVEDADVGGRHVVAAAAVPETCEERGPGAGQCQAQQPTS